MTLYCIDTVSQEQTDFVRKYLEETTDFNLGNEATKRYIGFSLFHGMAACHSNNPPSSPSSASALWRGYKKISVDELFLMLANKVKLGDRVKRKDDPNNTFRVIKLFGSRYGFLQESSCEVYDPYFSSLDELSAEIDNLDFEKV